MRKEEAVANCFITFGLADDEDYMTNLRLQKLMYFAQGWSLVFLKRPLFNEDMEAWPRGPVIPSIYKKYKAFGKDQIRNVDDEFSVSDFTNDEIELMSAVMAYYGKYSTNGLVDLTHKPGTPWSKTQSLQKKVIPKGEIEEFFKQLKPIVLASDKGAENTIGYHNADGVFVLPNDWDEDYPLE